MPYNHHIQQSMNWAYLHLVFNHFPIVGMIIGTSLLICGLMFKNNGIQISGLGTIVFASLMAGVAYSTGDPAKDMVKELPSVANSLMNRHEDIAAISMYLIIPAGLLAALTIYSILKKEKSISFLILITFVISLIATSTMVYTGFTGGQIRHSEFRSDSSKQYMILHQNDKEDYDED